MNTAWRERERVKDATETFNENYGQRAATSSGHLECHSCMEMVRKLRYRVRVDRNTGNPVNEGSVAYDPRSRQP